ncbi:MAG: hypothetical protein J0L96_20990 [Anaerolineae bacterium]|nr:hypothetical protein [Anaerolineae bacterium]
MISHLSAEKTFRVWTSEIVARIEIERVIVHGNRELIRLYEEKIKKLIEIIGKGNTWE